MPELSGIVTSFLPALLKILAMSIDLGFALSRPSLWKYLRADPTADRSYTDIAGTRDLALSDAFADLLHDGVIFRQTMFSILPLLSQMSRGWPVDVRKRKVFGLTCQSSCGLGQQAMVWNKGADECLSQVVKKVPAISNLYSFWQSQRSCLGIQACAITAENLGSRMSAKPLRGALCTTVRQ
jgi:hypothetical protein